MTLRKSLRGSGAIAGRATPPPRCRRRGRRQADGQRHLLPRSTPRSGSAAPLLRQLRRGDRPRETAAQILPALLGVDSAARGRPRVQTLGTVVSNIAFMPNVLSCETCDNAPACMTIDSVWVCEAC